MDTNICQDAEKVLLVGADLHADDSFAYSMNELASLAAADGKEAVGMITQSMDAPHKALCIGPGKVSEVREEAGRLGASRVIFDNTLSSLQIRNLQKELDLPVEDRTALILDIFRDRARSREARLQVECARLQYMLPRLVGLHDALGRQGGASGSLSNKGAGEKQLELDRRRLQQRLAQLRRELKEVELQRETQRKKRALSDIPRVALVGYTNAGKSTLLNALVEYCGGSDEKKVEEKDMLFATLDTTVRQITPEGHNPFLISDTVGFIRNLPHQLVEAFHATLEEAALSDLLIQVVDCSDPHYKDHMRTTKETLDQLGAGELPMIVVFNKADKLEESELPRVHENKIYMSASKRVGIEELLCLIGQTLAGNYRECDMLIPYAQSALTAYFQEQGCVREVRYLEEGTALHLRCTMRDHQRYSRFLVSESLRTKTEGGERAE